MNYEFPKIAHIDDVLPAIKDVPEFNIMEKEGYTVINYMVAGTETFPPITSKEDAIRRECRGIIFDQNGNIMARRYHKFFNIGEREETLPGKIDFSKPHVILEKLDGSMITPMIMDGVVRWGTKAGLTDVSAQVEEFLKNDVSDYTGFVRQIISKGYTPIFEWCSRKQRIVIDYPKDQLVLTAIRDTIHGEYVNYETMKWFVSDWDIPVVEKVFDSKVENIEEFIEKVRNSKVGEGCVIRFDDGHMLKLKTDYYIAIHKAKDALSSERKMVEVLFQGGLDDLKAVLNPEDRLQIEIYESAFWRTFNENLDLLRILENKFVGMDRKTFALEFAPAFHPLIRAMIFNLMDGKKTAPEILLATYIKNITNNKKFADLKHLFFREIKYQEQRTE